MSELLGVLEKTQNPAELQNASKFLEEAARGNLPLFLKELAKSELINIITRMSSSGTFCKFLELF